MNYTDGQLKQALAKMLPEKCYMNKDGGALYHQSDSNGYPIQPSRVLDSELLHICWLVEETLDEMESADYAELLRPIAANYKLLYHASWQQRVVALAKTKGVELKEEGE